MVGAPSRAPILGHRLSADTGWQTNDRFKRRAGYLGTAVSSNTRSGRRWWPGQYVLPYIRWTGPNGASLIAGGASKPFSITMYPARSANAGWLPPRRQPSGEAVAGFRHRIDERRVAARDLVGRDRPAAGEARRLAVLAVGVDRAVVRVVVVELDAAWAQALGLTG